MGSGASTNQNDIVAGELGKPKDASDLKDFAEAQAEGK